MRYSESIKNYFSLLIRDGAQVYIGENVFINNACSINCLEKIEIGANTLLGEGVKMYDHNHKYGLEADMLVVSKAEFNTQPIRIGKNCWIGSNCTILKGVSIGDNCIVGANCLIYKDVPSNTMVKANVNYSTGSM